MPFGEYDYAMDDKGRVVIPPAFREFVEDGMIITRGMEGCLYVFPLDVWKRLEEQPLRQFAALETEVVVAGAPNRLELWNPQRWNEVLSEVQTSPPKPELLENFIA